MTEPYEDEDAEAPHEPNALMRYGRALVWRMLAELVRRYPADLTLREERIHTGQKRGIAIRHAKADRSLFFHMPEPEGGMGMVGYLEPENAYGPLGEQSWQQTLGAFSRAGDGRVVLDDLAKQLRLGAREGIPPTLPYTLSWRLLAGFMAQAITGRRSWDLISGLCLDPYYGDTRRDELVDGFPDAGKAARVLLGTDDSAAEMWFLVEDASGHAGLEESPKATACLVPRAAQMWFPGETGVDLMDAYQSAGRHLWPALGAVLGRLLE